MPPNLWQHLFDTLKGLPSTPRYWIAYSGGLDSTVLLHLMASLRDSLGFSLHALHVNHGLSAQANEWAEQCREVCQQLDVPLQMESVEVTNTREVGLEAAARHARYAIFEQVLGKAELLLTAHHRDDQAETLLLQLMRGGGVHGLAAMPALRPLGKGHLARPMLSVSRDSLREYAEKEQLLWIDDPSNFDTSLERNYLRHTLLPQLEQRRAGIHQVLARSAGHFAESAGLLDELAESDLLQVRSGTASLSISALHRLSAERGRNVLRYFLRRLGLSVPQHATLLRIQNEVMPAREDASPQVSWPGAEVRRYRDDLHFMPPLEALPEQVEPIGWDLSASVPLWPGCGHIEPVMATGKGISLEKLQGGQCELRLRTGGEWLQPEGRREHHLLKKLFQEAGVAPWERERRPLLYLGEELVQVAGLWSAADYAVREGEEGFFLNWSLTAIENEWQNDDN